MADGFSQTILVGNIGADPEFKSLNGGKALLKIRMATTESYVDQTNTRKQRTEWHSVDVWGRYGETLSTMLTKGQTITVIGQNRTSTYEKDGEKRYKTTVEAKHVLFGAAFGDRSEAVPQEGAPAGARGGGDQRAFGGAANPQGQRQRPAPARDDDDDIPF